MSGDYRDEIKNLADRYSSAPGSRLFAPLADAYRKSGLIDKAIEICEEGLKGHPDYASARVILGKCFYDKGATERSREEFRRVLDIDGDNLVALKFLGDIYLAEGKRNEAAEYYKKLLVIDPTNSQIEKVLDEIKQEFKVREIDLGDRKAVKTVDHPRELATMTLAGIYASQGYYMKALEMYRELLAGDPGNKEASEMVTKLESMIESTEKEREKAFEENVLTISVDDIDSELIENSAGHGFGEAHAEGPGDLKVEEVAEELEEQDFLHEEDADEPQPAKKGPAESETDRSGEPEPGKREGDLNHFQDWLRQMQRKHGKDD